MMGHAAGLEPHNNSSPSGRQQQVSKIKTQLTDTIYKGLHVLIDKLQFDKKHHNQLLLYTRVFTLRAYLQKIQVTSERHWIGAYVEKADFSLESPTDVLI